MFGPQPGSAWAELAPSPNAPAPSEVVIAVAAITFIKFIIAPFGATLTFDDTSG
jgi:hypothetical protein